MPVFLGPLLAALSPWIIRFFLAKSVLMFVGFLTRLGIVLATNEYAIQPLIEHATTAWLSMPAEWQCWFGLFGVTKAASIMVSASLLLSAKQVFIAKA